MFVLINLKDEQIVAEPQKNDVYEIKLGDKNYTVYKVNTVVGDSVFLKVGLYHKQKSSQIVLKEMRDDAYYKDGILLPLSRNDLESMFEKHVIIYVYRKQE